MQKPIEHSMTGMQYWMSSVFVIDEVHMLSAAAFNAFLKTLEEPPHHAIFILATTEKHKIIPTILSRCQIYDFNRIKVEDGVEYLRHIASQEGVTADDEALNLIAHKADGGMRDALSMFDKAVSFCGTTLNYKDVASTLNVLDYDTYFTMTDMLLGGDYVNALIAFDGVLAKGFSPQVFIAGLNAHMRDLLMSKGPALSLVEFTGTLVERYKEQASRCSEAMLFNAIALLTEADGKIRQSSNQRLLVELGLMKIAGLGQKKNDEIDSPTFETTIALPELSQAAPSVATPSVTPSVAPVVSEPRVTPQPQVPQPAPQSQAPAPQPVAAERANTAGGQESAPPRRRTTSGRGSSTSISLNALIGGGAKTATELAEEAVAATEVHIDPQSESKLRAIKSSFVQNLMVKRPRFGVIFNTMEVEGNVVVVTVASQETANELLQNRTEWLNDIASAAGVDGTLDLRVVVNEEVRTARPITLEDRLKHLVAKNDKLKDMIEALALDAE